MKAQNKLASWALDATGHQFANTTLLQEAFTHSSLGGGESYERLEFLGDRVLGLVMAHWIWAEFPDDPEGRLATRFTGLVRRETLADVARSIDLGAQVRMAPSARTEGAQDKDSVLADCCEALIGALYIDGGLAAAEQFIKKNWADYLIDGPKITKDAKTRLQEWAQGRGLPLPLYEDTGRTGPDHQPEFIVTVQVQGKEAVQANGKSKREAQQAAAEKLLGHVLKNDRRKSRKK